MIEKHLIRSEADWLEMRKQDVTASDIAALVGKHEFLSHYGLWLLKAGNILPEVESDPMSRGKLLEPVIIGLVKKLHPDWTVISANDYYYRDAGARIGATPDLLAMAPSDPVVIDAKTVDLWTWKKEWDDGDSIPARVYMQMQVQAALTGADEAYVAVLVWGGRLDFRMLPVKVDPSVYGQLKAEVKGFWLSIANDKPPAPDFGRDYELLRKVYAQTGEIIDLSGDNEILEMRAEYRACAASEKLCKDEKNEIKARLLQKMGGANVAIFNGAEIAACKTIPKKGYSVEPTSYLDVRFRGKD